jgi:hypothetical protein
VLLDGADLSVTDDPRRASETTLVLQPSPTPTTSPPKEAKIERTPKQDTKEAAPKVTDSDPVAQPPAAESIVAAVPAEPAKPVETTPAVVDPAILPDPAIADPAGSGAVETAVADEPWTAERTIALLAERALANGSDPYEVLAVARCETGYSFMPWRDNGALRRGSLGEVGVGQWLPPVERNHWGRTPHWREYQYHILAGYLEGDPSAIWWDADALAWSMGPAAPAGFRAGWSCWRIRGPWWFM